jgi:primosomal protein N' (replication factor Y)
MDHPPLIIDVAIPVSLDTTFHYLVPPRLRQGVKPGVRVLVPFGRRTVTGYVLECLEESGHEGNLKEVVKVLDETPLLTLRDIAFYRWVATYYHHPLGLVLKGALPPGINVSSRSRGEEEPPSKQSGSRILTEKVCEALVSDSPEPRGKGGEILTHLRRSGPASMAELRGRFGDCSPQVRRLQELGLIRVRQREVYRSPFAAETVERDTPPPLLPEQEKAVTALAEAGAVSRFAPFLLYGVTGSGKTEVYLRAIQGVLSAGRSALVLVPEIALTPQLVRRFRRRFGDGMAVLHSALSDGERYDEWRRIRRGEVKIVIGARSAIFAPLENIGIIVVDEEHDSSYKQSEGLRYNGRDLALMRGKLNDALVLLGSATPLVTTWHGVQEGRLACLHLPRRVGGIPLPPVTVVDSRPERGALLSEGVRQALEDTLGRGEQSLLFLNRRGFATFLVCRACGATLSCPNCAVTLTHHQGKNLHLCHYCEYAIPAPSLCPACDGGEIGLFGAGTERVEETLAELFPSARIGRMDRDTVKGKGGHARVLRQLEEGEIDILVGTQMIAKGHDVPSVSFVGVLSTDAFLNLPDYLSAERTFQLLTQVAGRAGRGDLPGTVLVQTMAPDHYAVQAAMNHDFEGFYREEICHREEAFYPPFARLACVQISAVVPAQAEGGAEEAADFLRGQIRRLGSRIMLLGPAPAPLSRLRGRSRWQILLKSADRNDLHRLVALFRRNHVPPSGLRCQVDMDPVDML